MQKTLVIGLDGATFDVLTPLMEQGLMPNLAALMQAGSSGRLASTIPPFTPTAWSSFITGRNPGEHGVWSFRLARDRFNYDIHGSGFINARRLGTTLWEILGAGGKRVAVVNVPMTYPARAIDGLMVTGMLTPLGADHFTHPPELATELDQNYVIDVDFVRGEKGFRARDLPAKKEMITKISDMTRLRAQACMRMLKEGPWDFFMVVFTGTDRVMHFFWDDLMMLLEGDPGANASIQNRIRAYFQELDEAIGQLVKQAGPSATVMVVSDHGFGPAQTSRFYVNIWLERLGLLEPRGYQGLLDLEHWRTMIGRREHLKAILRRLLPASAQDRATAAARAASEEIIDWSQTYAYFVPIYFHVCGIEINLAGARRAGTVQPGVEYESLRDQIVDEAKRLRDPRNERPIVEVAARREELYHGGHVDDFPDIILSLAPEYIGASSLAGGSLVESHSPARSGEHRQDGVFIAAGPSIRQLNELSSLSLLDIPPTILWSLGQPIPENFDGRVLQEVFSAAFLAANPVRTRSPSTPLVAENPESRGYPETEQSKIEDRLRGLGYIE